MTKFFQLTLLLSFITLTAEAQYRYKGRMYTGTQRDSIQREARLKTSNRSRNKYKPSFNFNIGLGYPNLDKNEMLEFTNYTPGKASQEGPFFLSADYQFNATTSFGIMAAYGKVSRPYYYANNVAPSFTGSLQNTALMLNVIRYFPVSKIITPFLHTAIGINISRNSYMDSTGRETAKDPDDNTFAYQASLGIKLNIVKHMGLFVEAGYGKYIVTGGLAFKL